MTKMTKEQARETLHDMALRMKNTGWRKSDFVDNFDSAFGLETQEEAEAFGLVPDSIEHIAEIVWS